MPQRRQAQQMHVPMSTQKHSKKRLFSSAQGWGEGGWARPIALSEGSSLLVRPLSRKGDSFDPSSFIPSLTELPRMMTILE